jgi:hypothetical protein
MTEQHTHEVSVETDGDGHQKKTETRTENGKTVEHSVEQDGKPQQVQPDGR